MEDDVVQARRVFHLSWAGLRSLGCGLWPSNYPFTKSRPWSTFRPNELPYSMTMAEGAPEEC
jgi:hypothetical protein